MINSEDKKIDISVKKAKKFKEYAVKYLEKKKNIKFGLNSEKEYSKNKEKIKKLLNATEEDWKDWKWQIRNRISDTEILGNLVSLSEKEKNDLDTINKEFRWAFTPHIASIIDFGNPNCPVRLQMVPKIDEMEKTGLADFSGEEYSSPVQNMVRWYPDRVAVHVTNICAGFCRHCLRRRKIGEVDTDTPNENIDEIFKYLKANPEIRDVLLTGGDPFLFSTEKLDKILTELEKIKSIEIKRIGTRTPITVPQRINKELCDMLSKHHPLYVNIQVNHPKEITKETARALDLLSKAGIPLANQSVLMKDINDTPAIYKALCHELLKVRVKPYYLYHCQGTIGIEHLRTPVETGIEIIENLRGYTSGMAVPQYIITPTGYGKTPLSPNYRWSSGEGYVWLRNWEGIPYKYKNPK